ncbi:MAG: single-stranded-DNA-specific exonuclease, single-stranded-DNA-specific exonuclease [Candidatus Parcubacteria bacterium]|jgi:single-stranded-DNA-specific exonuclease
MSAFLLPQAATDGTTEMLCDFSPLLQQLFVRRGITSKEEAHQFLNPSYEDHLHDPFLLHDMERSVERILSAMKNGEQIAVYSDYDCDGIPGAVVLHDFFNAIGYSKFQNYIPHRHFEGFGFNSGAVEKLHKDEVTLIVTIDCGTTDFEAVARANELGIDVIITDHHEPKETLPSAFAVVNPKVGTSYPFDGLCGSGVIFKLVQALLARGKADGSITLKEGQEKWLLDMVGLATIADMVPLVGENRALAHFGLHVLRKNRRLGLQHLLSKQNADARHLTEDDIGFTIGPRINAASRMDAPLDAFHMLSSTNEADAAMHVMHLEKLNNERKGIVASMTKDAHKRLLKKESVPEVIVLGDPLWRPSLAGLLANKLAEEYKRPAFVWGRDGRGLLKGSCRSDGRSSVVTLMNAVPEIFFEFGGHHMSGGFGVREEYIHTFGEMLCGASQKLGIEALIDEENVVDAVLTLEEVTPKLLGELALLAPYGVGNPKPLFVFQNIVPQTVAVFGKASEHTKLTFETNGKAKEAIAFFTLPEEFSKLPTAGEPLSLYGHIEQSFFMGRLQTRIRIVDTQ